MRFINRKKELSFIKEAKDLSNKKTYLLSVFGLRRVGKTRLILETLNSKDLYFFINKDKSSYGHLREFEEILKNKKLMTDIESLRNWDDFFNILFERFKGIVVFDEFQNFLFVDKTIFGIIQKYVDLNEYKKELLFIFSGSITGLMHKLFNDVKEPLYGRLKRFLHLKPLNFFETLQFFKELQIDDIEQIIKLYSIFGGFPKYYVSIEDENLISKKFDDIFERFFIMENALLENEVMSILSLEFGRRSGVYYDILTAISNGSTRISEVASYLQKKETDLTRQIHELVNQFGLIDYEQQVIGNKKTMYIVHPLIDFWFKHFYKNLSSYKKRDMWFVDKTKQKINHFISRRFEEICTELLLLSQKNFNFDKIGRQWGKFKGEKGKNTYEIDICGINNAKKEILFAESKWSENVDAKKVLSELKQKAEYVDWHTKKSKISCVQKTQSVFKDTDKRKESYVIFAKSFKNKHIFDDKKINEFSASFKNKNIFDDKKIDVKLYDLKDLEKMFK